SLSRNRGSVHETTYQWIKNVYAEKNISEPRHPVPSRIQTASPALDGVFVLGRGFCSFENMPCGLITPDNELQHPDCWWSLSSCDRGSLAYLFFKLTVATNYMD